MTGDARLRDRYATAAAEHRAELTRRISVTGAHHLVLRTDRDWVVDLVRFVGRRRSQRSSAARSINGSRR